MKILPLTKLASFKDWSDKDVRVFVELNLLVVVLTVFALSGYLALQPKPGFNASVAEASQSAESETAVDTSQTGSVTVKRANSASVVVVASGSASTTVPTPTPTPNPMPNPDPNVTPTPDSSLVTIQLLGSTIEVTGQLEVAAETPLINVGLSVQ